MHIPLLLDSSNFQLPRLLEKIEVERVILRCLQKNPADRFDSVAEIELLFNECRRAHALDRRDADLFGAAVAVL